MTQRVCCSSHKHTYCVLTTAVQTPQEANSAFTISFVDAYIFYQHTMEMGCFDDMLALESPRTHIHHILCLWGSVNTICKLCPQEANFSYTPSRTHMLPLQNTQRQN